MKLLWLTDIHLNIAAEQQLHDLCTQINGLKADLVMLSGDIADGPTLEHYLLQLEQRLECDIYFVLGNHDFYHSSIAAGRSTALKLSKADGKLHYLGDDKIIELSPQCCLIGHDGWSDGRSGDFMASTVMLNDYRLIEELSDIDQTARLQKLNALGDEAAQYLRRTLSEAFKTYRQVILLTHVPPFLHSGWHEGHWSDDNYAPHFICQSVGETLEEMMKARPNCQLNVYCGHTHSEGTCHILPNLTVVTGAAQYNYPKIQPPIFVR